jgi:G3E family GTPase
MVSSPTRGSLGARPVPLLVVTGFPGAGKSTLLARWIADASFAPDTEFVDAWDDCDPRARCERIVMEAGLAGPGPVLDDLAADAGEHFRLHGVVAAVDALEGAACLEIFQASRAQAAVADVLVLTKLDLASPRECDRLSARLARINPDAEIMRPAPGGGEARAVWHAAGGAAGKQVRYLRAALEASGTEGFTRTSLRFAKPVELSGFCMRLAAFLEAHAGRVLRVKGLLAVEGRRGPAAIHAVGARVYPVRTLRQWPGGRAESALEVVGCGLEEDAMKRALQ